MLKTTNPVVRPCDSGVKRFWRIRRYTAAFGAADAVWSLSDAETAGLRKVFPAVADRFCTVVNPYVTPAMLAAEAERPADGERHVLAVGRLAPQKRLDLLVQAFALVDDPAARLTVLGEGRERAGLEALVARLGLSDRVDFPGFVANVAGWYRRADLLVLPSVYEGCRR